MAAIEDDPIGCRVLLHVSPRASRTRVVGLHDGRVKLQVAAPPVDGEANAEVERFLARALDVPRDRVAIVAGATGKRKAVRVEGVTAAAAAAALGVES
ncbi:MAG: DUF167 domain-containing protein [Deltaproteobacteria bacterium]|nr:DUF167 domain-containing protein [Deltaproteobacteria bacterium]